MKTPPRTGGALKGFKNMKRFPKFKPVRPTPQPPCVPTLPPVGAAIAGTRWPTSIFAVGAST